MPSLTMAERAFRAGGVDIKCFPLWENSKGLSEAYNDFLDSHKNEFDCVADNFDCVLFIHDDLTINDCQISEKLKDAMDDRGWDVVGVAGSKGFSIPNPSQRTGWWSAPNAQCGLVGGVLHHDKDNGQSIYTSYGKSPSPALVVDGCFIAMSGRAIARGLRFDPTFTFHCYDVDLCLTAWQMGLKTGVEPILVTHDSPGLGFTSDEFMKAQQLLVEKWGLR